MTSFNILFGQKTKISLKYLDRMKIEGVSPFSVADNKDDWICPPCTKPNLRASENGSHRCLPEYSVSLRHWGILTPNPL